MLADVIVTDRSRLESWWRCHRQYYYTYLFKGRGIVPRGENEHLAFGKGIHAATDIITSGGARDEALKAIKDECDKIVGVTPDGYPRGMEYYAHGFGLVNTLIDVSLPKMLSEYEFMPECNELEFIITLDKANPDVFAHKGVVQMIRIDSAVRRKSDGKIFLVETKSEYNPKEVYPKYMHNMQIMMEMNALSTHIGEEVGGTIMFVYSKPRVVHHKDDKSLIYRVSPFNYCWKYHLKKSDVPILSDQWHKDAIRTPTWIEPGLEEWMKTVDAGVADKTIDWTIPIAFDETMYESVRKQVVRIERRNHFLNSIEGIDGFEQNWGNCNDDGGFRRECPFAELCRNATAYADPLKTGLYEWREPNHPLEESMINGG